MCGSGKNPKARIRVSPEIFTSQLGLAATSFPNELPRKKPAIFFHIFRVRSKPGKKGQRKLNQSRYRCQSSACPNHPDYSFPEIFPLTNPPPQNKPEKSKKNIKFFSTPFLPISSEKRKERQKRKANISHVSAPVRNPNFSAARLFKSHNKKTTGIKIRVVTKINIFADIERELEREEDKNI